VSERDDATVRGTERVDWKKWRATLEAVGLSPLKRRMLEKKQRKGKLRAA
jgi:hypothetical protein